MKKSTLITTIAMIVVVVVALSTATYAWFSAGTANTVESSMTTTAVTGWLLYGGTGVTAAGTGEDTITYSSNSSINLNLMNGLFSPSGTIGSNLSGNSLSETYTQVKFFQAEQEGTGIVSKINLAEVNSPKYTHTVGESEVDNLNYIRVINNNAEASANLILTICVYAANGVAPELISGKQFATAIIAHNGTTATLYNTEYYYGTQTTDSTEVTRSNAKVPASGVTYVLNASEETVKTAGELPGIGYTTAPSNSTFSGIDVSGKQYYLMTIDMGPVLKYASVDIVFYAWFDGWALDNTASGATVNMIYAFGSTAQSVTTGA